MNWVTYCTALSSSLNRTVISPPFNKTSGKLCNNNPIALTFYCLPAVGKLYTLKEKKEMEKSSEDPFVQLQQFKLPSLMP